jgi:Zn-dependent protease with chaperone function
VIEFSAAYYDGRTSERRPVRARGIGASLHVSGPEVNFEVPLAQVSVDAPLAGSARTLRLPGEAQLQTEDHAAVEALFPRAHPLEGFVHRLERRWPYALGGAVLLALAAWWILVDGLPRAAQFAAGFVPTQIEARLGAQALELVDARFCRPTKLGAARREALSARFARLAAGLDDGYAYRLELRDCGALGANAFALPGGTVILTDALAKLATDDDQLSAVLAHEIGHVRLRHGLRTALQAAGLAAISAAVLGDAVSVTSLAVTVPTAVLQNGYSRAFEADADEYAFGRLKQLGISPAAFADAMELLEKSSRGDQDKKQAPSSFDYFSTHPATAKRIERARAAAGQ